LGKGRWQPGDVFSPHILSGVEKKRFEKKLSKEHLKLHRVSGCLEKGNPRVFLRFARDNASLKYSGGSKGYLEKLQGLKNGFKPKVNSGQREDLSARGPYVGRHEGSSKFLQELLSKQE